MKTLPNLSVFIPSWRTHGWSLLHAFLLPIPSCHHLTTVHPNMSKRTSSGTTKDTPRPKEKVVKDTEGFFVFKKEQKAQNKRMKVVDIRSKWEDLSPQLQKVSILFILRNIENILTISSVGIRREVAKKGKWVCGGSSRRWKGGTGGSGDY